MNPFDLYLYTLDWFRFRHSVFDFELTGACG